MSSSSLRWCWHTAFRCRSGGGRRKLWFGRYRSHVFRRFPHDPLHPAGLGFFFLSGGLLVSGVIAADLAALLWGGGFLTLTVYTFAASAWLGFRLGSQLRSG